MTLSVCCFTSASAPLIGAMLAPLRGVADEVVLAADARTDPAELDAYRELADAVHVREFDVLEHHLAWLHEQCSGDWVLRLDSDEQVSPELVAVLPELIADPNLKQYWLPRRWLDPSGRGWYDELPWAPAFHNRLVRNDGSLRFTGVLHSGAEPAFPSAYRPEPFYHLLCELESREQRLEHSLRYEVQKPHFLAPGGGPLNATYYLPERFARRAPKPLDAAGASVGSLPLRLLEADLRMYAGEVRPLFVEVRNDTDVHWPGGMEDEPRIRLSYRWEDGADGERTPLPAPLEPGAAAIAPVVVVAPAEIGRHRLRLGIVHEDVRWLDAELAVDVEIVRRNQRQRSIAGRAIRRFRAQRIPNVVHRIWTGPEPLPDEQQAYGETWRRHHPEWEHRLWRDEDLSKLALPPELAESNSPAQVADVARLHILARHGGVYVDTDVECLRPLDPLLGGLEFFAGFEEEGLVGTAIIGATPQHPAILRAAELVRTTFGYGGNLPSTSGPAFFTHVLWDFPEVTIFPPEYFFPYNWSEPERRHERFERAYAVHHWAMSWNRDSVR